MTDDVATGDEGFLELQAQLEGILAALNSLQEQIKAELPSLEAARQAYCASSTDENRTAMEQLETKLQALLDVSNQLHAVAEQRTGLTEEIIEAFAQPRQSEDRCARETLTAEKIAPNAHVEDYLAAGIDAICSYLPPQWLESEPADAARLIDITQNGAFLSLTRGLRIESESSNAHRLRRAIRASQDYLAGTLSYDHFAGATLVPTIAQFGRQWDALLTVGGDLRARIDRLWHGPSEEVDSTCFELLTAAACARLGRSVEFIPESPGRRTPDLRCHDPFPLFIECKRQRALLDFELTEELVMRDIFQRLRARATNLGAYGTYHLKLFVPAHDADIEEVVARLSMQRLSPDPRRQQMYAWGETAYIPSLNRTGMPQTTRLYSPNMLAYAFGWNSDLPEWDGLCCSIGNAQDMFMDQVEAPVGLLWTNESAAAKHRRMWSPINLFGSAVDQIPPGSFGAIYIAYVEGTRAEIADQRVHRYAERIKDWEHSGRIRVPISFLDRLYPRALGEGIPDLIDSGLRFCSSFCDPSLLDDFPAAVFTR